MFEKRTTTIEVDGYEFEVWANPPRGQLEARGSQGNVAMLAYILTGWNLGGESYDDYTFPDAPTEEAINALPIDTSLKIATAYGESIRNTLPKPSATRSSRSTKD